MTCWHGSKLGGRGTMTLQVEQYKSSRGNLALSSCSQHQCYQLVVKVDTPIYLMHKYLWNLKHPRYFICVIGNYHITKACPLMRWLLDIHTYNYFMFGIPSVMIKGCLSLQQVICWLLFHCWILHLSLPCHNQCCRTQNNQQLLVRSYCTVAASTGLCP